MDEKILDRVAKRYFDSKFEDSEIRMGKGEYEFWYGFYIGDTLILGHLINEDDKWFYNGEYFLNGPNFFDIQPREFSKAMERYLSRKYPYERVKNIM